MLTRYDFGPVPANTDQNCWPIDAGTLSFQSTNANHIHRLDLVPIKMTVGLSKARGNDQFQRGPYYTSVLFYLIRRMEFSPLCNGLYCSIKCIAMVTTNSPSIHRGPTTSWASLTPVQALVFEPPVRAIRQRRVVQANSTHREVVEVSDRNESMGGTFLLLPVASVTEV